MSETTHLQLTLPAERAAQATEWMQNCNPKLTAHDLEVYRLAYERGYDHGQQEAREVRP